MEIDQQNGDKKMGANMGKSYTYNPHYSMRRRTSSPSENNNFSKEYWGTANGEASGGVGGGGGGNGSQAYWMVDNEKRYRQEVFQRNGSNFYQPQSSYHTTSSFDSPFSSNSSKSSLRRGQSSFDKQSSSLSAPVISTPSLKPPIPKYVGNYVSSAIGGRV